MFYTDSINRAIESTFSPSRVSRDALNQFPQKQKIQATKGENA